MSFKYQIEKIRRLASWRSQASKCPWFQIIPFNAPIIFTLAILIATTLASNSFVRQQQLNGWLSNEEFKVSGTAPSFSTADAPFYLSHAKALKSGQTINELRSKRIYPNQKPPNLELETGSSPPWPLLSVIIKELSFDQTNEELLIAGNRLLILSAAITAATIVFCFGAAGYWFEGCVAGMGGGLSAAYLVRSSIGRIDTDQLNLAFMYGIFGFCIAASTTRSRVLSVCHCVFAGSAANLFLWWYGKVVLVIIISCSLLWLLIFVKRDLFVAIIGWSAFVVISGVSFTNPFATAYFKKTIVHENFIFPNTLQTITEIKVVDALQIMISATGSVEMGGICVAGLALFYFRHPTLAVGVSPLIFFAALNFVIGNRAIFYSAPFLWFGCAYLMSTTAKYIATSISHQGNQNKYNQYAIVCSSILAMAVAWINSPTNYVPKPSFPKSVLVGLESLKKAPKTNQAVVATWWDYGYASLFLNGLPIFHDGGSQTTPSTYFIARALLDQSQDHSVRTLKYLAIHGHEGILSETSIASLDEKFANADVLPSPEIFLVVTGQMQGWISSISQIGNWDIERGQPVALRGNPNGPLVNYERLNCSLAGYPETLTCPSLGFDLERGLINNVPLLTGWAHTRDGTVVRKKNFKHDGDQALQIVQTGKRINVFLMHRQLFESSFNELYHLGQIDHPMMSLYYDDYPHIRIYKIEGEPSA